MANKNKRGGARIGSGRQAKYIKRDRLTIVIEASTKKKLYAAYPGRGAVNDRIIQLINKDLDVMEDLNQLLQSRKHR